MIARRYATIVYSFPTNRGKASAAIYGAQRARFETLLFLDADLEQSAAHAFLLLKPLFEHEADMSVAVIPPGRHSGFGLVKRLAAWGIYVRTKHKMQAPLSGQRAIKKQVFFQHYRGDRNFGIEVGLTLDVLQAGLRVMEVEVPFDHRERGKTLTGFLHRFKQGVCVCEAFLARKS